MYRKQEKMVLKIVVTKIYMNEEVVSTYYGNVVKRSKKWLMRKSMVTSLR